MSEELKLNFLIGPVEGIDIRTSEGKALIKGWVLRAVEEYVRDSANIKGVEILKSLLVEF